MVCFDHGYLHCMERDQHVKILNRNYNILNFACPFNFPNFKVFAGILL